MKPLKASPIRALPHGTIVDVIDNSGAKRLKIITVPRHKTVKGRYPSAGVADLVQGSVVKGRPDMRKQVVHAVIVRQKKEYRRKDGTRMSFQDNAAVVVKDVDGNPKGTVIKGPIAREAANRWPAVSKIATNIV